MSSKNHNHDNAIYGVDGTINPQNRWFRTMRFPTVEQRGYRLGERNPDTLPGGPDRESNYENERHTSRLRGPKSALAFANQIGGKYV